MGVPRQLTQIAFASPLDESTVDEILDPTVGFPVLQNVRQDRRGGLSKRLGFDPLPVTTVAGSSRTEGRRCFAHLGNPCVIGSNHLYAYSAQLDDNIDCGRVPDVSVEVRPLPASASIDAPTQHDQVICNGFLILVYGDVTTNEPFGGKVVVTTADDGTVVLNDGQQFGSTAPNFQVGAFGTTAFLVEAETTSANLSVYKLDCTSATTVASGWTNIYSANVSKNTSSGALSLQSLDDRIAVGFINSSGGTSRVTVMSFDGTGLLQTRAINTSSVTPDNVAIEGRTSGRLWVCWNEGDPVKIIGIDPSTLSTTLVTADTILTGGLLSSNPPSLVSDTGTGGSIIAYGGGFVVRRSSWVGSGTLTPGSQFDLYGATVNGRAFAAADGRLLNLFEVDAVGSTSQGTVILADWSFVNGLSFPPLTMAYPNLASADPAAHSVTFSDGRIGYVVRVVTSSASTSFALVICDFANIERWRPTFHNGVTFLSGGLLSYFSGDCVQECSFLHAPRNIDITPDGGGTGPTGAVQYVVTFEGIDGAGNLSISGASDPFAYTGTGVQLFPTCDPLLLTTRAAVRAVLWRTETNGKTYYRVDARNALTGSTITFVDDLVDSSLILRPRLYGTGVLPGTYGAPLQREAPPFCRDVVSFSGMLVVASGSDLWWSGQTIGGEGTWFSTEQFFVPVDGEGVITALKVQDGSLYVFKERAIYVVGGDPPSDNGSAGGLGSPRRLAGDVGCISTNSVVSTSLGIFFLSHRGIELLGRGSSPVWIGEKVQRTLESYPSVTSAVLDVRNNILRFTLATGITSGRVAAYVAPDSESPEALESGGGRDVVFDLTLNDWQSVDDKHGSTAHEASQDACTVTLDNEQKYVWLGRDGILRSETDLCLDGSTWITMLAETGWFKIAGIQGKQQFNRMLTLARKYSDCDLSVALGYTYDETYADARVWTSDTLSTLLTKWPITQVQHDASDDGEGQSLRVRIADASPTGDAADIGSGRGATWLALTLDITPKDGPAEVPEEAA